MKCFFVYGKDERQNQLRKIYNANLVNKVEEAKYVIFPTPFSSDGVNITGEDIKVEEIIPKLEHKSIFGGKIPRNVVRLCEINNIECYDIMNNEALAILNAIPTAEGTIQKIMEFTRTTIYNSNVLILGFGKCGKVLADRLYGLKANVFCEARNEKDIALIKALGYNGINIVDLDNEISKMDVVINTVPYMLLNRRRIDLLKPDALIIDIASAPGGTDFDYCKEKGIKAYLELGIPAKVAPVSSSLYIQETIDKIINGKSL